MKVRKGKVYEFNACGWDVFDRNENTPENGTLVRVIHAHGCPPPNTMNHCHVEGLNGEFIGLVSCNSLSPADPKTVLRYHVTGKIERGEGEAIVGKPALWSEVKKAAKEGSK